MCRTSLPIIAAIAFLYARVALCQEGLVATEADGVALLQISKTKAGRAESREEPRVPSCSWPTSSDAADETVDDAANPAFDARGALFEVPAAPQSKEAPDGSASSAWRWTCTVWFLRSVLYLWTCTVVANSAWRWHRESRGDDLEQVAEPQSEGAARSRLSAASPMHACHRELREAALAGDAARCEAALDAADARAVGGASEVLVCADGWGSTVMHAAARSGAEPVLRLLLERRAQVDPVDCGDETPLHVAARQGHADACAVLAAEGASLRARNAQDHTPLDVAGFAGKDAACNRLLDFGAWATDSPKEDVPPLVTELVTQ